MEIKQDSYKGTRILFGKKAAEKRILLNYCISVALKAGYSEMMIPIIQFQNIFLDKVGEENNKMMFLFEDLAHRQICLAPEYTAVVQSLALTRFKFEKDIKLFYVVECFRAEKPQAGRYRQFTQFGLEILNPSKDYTSELKEIVSNMIGSVTSAFEVNSEVTRGLDYYKEGKGFEITVESLGAQKQICGGGVYEGGIGCAIGIDRLILV